MIFIGPTLLSGIGQAVNKYCQLLNGTYIQLGQEFHGDQDIFIFALPIGPWLDAIPAIKKKSKSLVCMTICETETVHPDYGKLFDMFDLVVTPSVFCQTVFKRQFPDTRFEVIHSYVPLIAPPKVPVFNVPRGSHYVFYHIGNVMDQRKNVKKIIEAFIRLQLPDSLLILKATCHTEVTWKVPGVHIINGLLPDEMIRSLHNECHCYVSFSSSEGVGMGAVEAALYDKPVIITEYGAPPEYIKTPYLIECGRQEIACDDFLFQKGMVWGKPDFNQLMTHMKHAYDNKVKKQDHTWTRELVSEKNVKEEFKNLLGL
jgi:glycosyltransferase involved in cell wall biosynthesis